MLRRTHGYAVAGKRRPAFAAESASCTAANGIARVGLDRIKSADAGQNNPFCSFSHRRRNPTVSVTMVRNEILICSISARGSAICASLPL